MTIKKKGLLSIDPAAAQSVGAEYELKDPATGKGLGMFVTLTGKEGRQFRAHVEGLVDRDLADQFNGKKDEPQTAAKLVAAAIELCAACTLSWRGVVLDEAEGELPFTPENVRKVYAMRFVREQIDAAIGNASLFTNG